MQYSAPTNLPELTSFAERTQAMLGTLISDLETMPAASIQFRLEAMGQVTDYIYRMTAVCKTLIALRASSRRNTESLKSLNATIRELHKQICGLKSRTKDELGTPPLPTAAPNPTETANNPGSSGVSAISDFDLRASDFPPQTGAPSPPYESTPPFPMAATGTAGIPAGALHPRAIPDLSLDSSFIVPSSSFSPVLRFAPKRLPRIEDLIPAARLPRSVTPGEEAAQRTVHQVHSVNNVHPDQSTQGTPPFPTPAPNSPGTASLPAGLSDRLTSGDAAPCSSFSVPNSSFPSDPQPSTRDPLQKLFSSIESRIPDSIKDPDFQLPRQSDKAADFAPLLKLDLLPLTHTIPVYPLANSDRIEHHLTDIQSGINKLQSDLNPPATADPDPALPNVSAVLDVPEVLSSPSSELPKTVSDYFEPGQPVPPISEFLSAVMDAPIISDIPLPSDPDPPPCDPPFPSSLSP